MNETAENMNRYEAVPEELRQLPQWMCWRKGELKADGRREKPPVSPHTGYDAGHNEAANRGSFEQAVAAVGRYGLGGISFVPTKDDPFTLVDIDKCRNAETGEITKPWVEEWLRKADTYAESSPSGTGFRIIAKGSVSRTINVDGVEMYSRGQQLTITGDHLPDMPADIREAQEALTELFNKYASRQPGITDLKIDESEPPMKLSGWQLEVWRGERPKRKDNGDVDRSATLYDIGGVLAKAGATARVVRSAVAERDAALGFRKYLDRPDDRAEREYARIAVKAVAKVGVSPDPDTMRAAEISSAANLMERKLPPLRWAVPDILPEGVSILAGKPKIGKSWIALDLCLSIAQGGQAFNVQNVERGNALYLALEDNDRRLQRRIKKWLGGDGRPSYVPDFDYAIEWPRMGEGCEEKLRGWLEANPNARLVVIDTLKKVRPMAGANRSMYDVDYEALEPLLPLAAEFGVSILVLHHTRKMGSDDPLELVSGSFGTTGGVDGVLVMQRQRGKPDGELYVDGRDVEDSQEYAIRWDDGFGCWVLKGNAADFRRSEERRAVLGYLEKQGDPKGVTDIADHLEKKSDTVRRLVKKMADQGEIVKVGPEQSPKYALPEGKDAGGRLPF